MPSTPQFIWWVFLAVLLSPYFWMKGILKKRREKKEYLKASVYNCDLCGVDLRYKSHPIQSCCKKCYKSLKKTIKCVNIPGDQ